MNALVYGIGQIVLGVLVLIAAYELMPAARTTGVRVRGIVVALVAFAAYALFRGVRQARSGQAALRAARRDTPDS